MKTRMHICGLLALAISPICLVHGEETSPAGMVHGPKAGFDIAVMGKTKRDVHAARLAASRENVIPRSRLDKPRRLS